MKRRDNTARMIAASRHNACFANGLLPLISTTSFQPIYASLHPCSSGAVLYPDPS